MRAGGLRDAGIAPREHQQLRTDAAVCQTSEKEVRAMKSGTDWRRLVYSAVIIGVLLPQTVTSFGHTDRFFPFLWYPMYAKPHFAGERIEVGHRIYAVTPDGYRHLIDAESDLDIDFWRYERRLARPLVAGDLHEVRYLLKRIVARYPTLIGIEVDDYPMVITREGPVPAKVRTVATVRRSAMAEYLA
jgi:hypothetical protein